MGCIGISIRFRQGACACAEHLLEVFKHPDSDVPIPYTELLITGTPGYKKRDAGMSGLWCSKRAMRSCKPALYNTRPPLTDMNNSEDCPDG